MSDYYGSNQAGLFSLLPFSYYTNTYQHLGADQANVAQVQRFYNPVPLTVRHLCLYNGRPAAAGSGVIARICLYGVDASIKLFDSGLIDCTSLGPKGDGNIIIDLASPFEYDTGYYFAWEACNSAAFQALGFLVGSEYNAPVINAGTLPGTLDASLTPPTSFDISTITMTGGFIWAFGVQS